MSKIKYLFMMLICISFVACENDLTVTEALKLNEVELEVVSLEDYLNQDNAATPEFRSTMVVSFDAGGVVHNPQPDFIIICQGGPIGGGGSCFAVHGTNSCGDVNCSENCYCYD